MKKFELGSFEFILILTLIDDILPTIKNILLNGVNWWILIDLFGAFCILYAVYIRQLWGYKLATFIFGVETISNIVFLFWYIKDFGLSRINSNPRLFTINSISLLWIIISLSLFVFFLNIWRKYRLRKIT